MIPFRFTLMSLILSAAPALACGGGECDPPAPPPPPPPPVIERPAPRPDGDRDPAVATPVIHFSYCCQIDGRMHLRTGWLRDPARAREQCEARKLRLQSLPECPRHIRRKEGGE